MTAFRSGGARNRHRGKINSRRGAKTTFTTSRIEDPPGVEDGSTQEEQEGREEDEMSDTSSSGNESAVEQIVRPYNTLLQSFHVGSEKSQPRRKRRKLNHEETIKPQIDEAHEEILGSGESDVDLEEATKEVIGGEDADEEDATDPFEVHFSISNENELAKAIKAISENEWENQKNQPRVGGRMLLSTPGKGALNQSVCRPIASLNQLKLKRKLIYPASHVISEFGSFESEIASHVFDYRDVLLGARTVLNADELRKMTCLHALNHIFKTRDRVLKNNAKLSRGEEGDEELELRDQGFTRPKVLILLETRHACVKTVNTMVQLCEPEQQENKKRFEDSFAQTERSISENKPEDFKELFEGNDDNEFRIGIKFTRKAVKFFTHFYTSDLIIASPLGLRRAIDQGNPKRKKDADFLSSIEVVIMDQADAMLMQNWEHVKYVFDHLNLQPKESHGCDFSRVRHWYLDGNAKYLRQTIILSAYLTPELNSIYSSNMLNVAGRVKYQPEYDGSPLSIGLQVKQTFSRFDSPSPIEDPDARFKYFTTAIIPAINRYPRPVEGRQGILVFIPSYLDFVRIRNYFADSTATQNISFGAVSEYTEVSEARRARSHFLTGRHSVLLYTGRAHHFNRYQIKGVKKVIMYGLPETPVFYQEIVSGYLGASIGEGRLDPAEASVRVVFSKWDGLKLERVVGTKRVSGMVRDRSGDTFDFI